MMATLAPVGGRLEAAPPRPVTNPGDRWRLAVLVAVAAAAHAAVVARTQMTARDGVGFARTALQIAEPATIATPDLPHPAVSDVLRQPGHPPGYPLALLAAAQAVTADTVQDRMLYAGQLVSAVAGTLLALPLYWFGRTLFGQAAGFAGALLFAGLPVAVRYTSDAVTEGLYLLLLATALLLGTRAVRKPGVGGFLLCGMTTGLAYLVRPEGVLAVAAVGLASVALVVARRWAVSATAGRLTALAVGFLLAASPYMLLIGGFTSKPSLSGLKVPFLRQAAAGQAAAAPPGPALFAKWMHDDNRLPGVLSELVKESTKSFHYLPAGFALVGLGLAARRLRADPWLLVPLAYGGLTVLALVALGLKEGYISERHTLPLVLVACPFAAAGFLAVGRWVGRPWLGWALLAGVLVSGLPALAKPLHRERLGHKEAGLFLAQHAAPEDVVIDPFDWAGFYSGRTLKSIPPDPPATAGRSRWAVIEPKEKPGSTLPRLEAALNVANDGKNKAEVAFTWPPGPPEDAKVVVYRQTIK
jgi:4-amino-4-deoxy-L-arabinose transferase-like glycosyltransferase